MRVGTYSRAYDAAWQLSELVRRSDAPVFLRTLDRTQYLPRDQLRAFQVSRLRELLIYADRYVPYYTALFRDCSFDPGELSSVSDLERLPLLTRDTLRTNSASMVSTQPRRGLFENGTGGSTGSPVQFFQDDLYHAWWKANRIRTRRWFDFDRGDRIAYLWGANQDIPDWSRRARLVVALKREKWLNTFKVTPERMEAFARVLVRWRPLHIVGYSSGLEEFARFVRESGIKGIRPRSIESSAEKLWPEQRELIEEVFGAPVYDVYGSREMGFIAAECPGRAMHVLADMRVLQIVDDRGNPMTPGETGRIVVTDLTNYAMPLIRYEIGDLGVERSGSGEPCPCGRTLPRLERVVGRSHEMIRTPAGGIHSEFFSRLFYHFPGVRKFQVRQVAPDEVVIDIVRGGGFDPGRLEAVRERIAGHTDGVLRTQFRMVDAIEPTNSGKRRFVVSEIENGA